MNAIAHSQDVSRGIGLFQVAGIRIRLDYSWFIVFFLVLWSLSSGYFPSQFPDHSRLLYWIAGIFASFLFFASLLAHELGHSLVAMKEGMKISEIALFIFGGIAKLSGDVKNPWSEIKIALAGPIVSFALAGGFWVLYSGMIGLGPELVGAILQYLAWINVMLAIFNLFPGFPLDGGRVLRAVLWWKTGNVLKATKWASNMGKGFGFTLMILGVLEIFFGGLVEGIWLFYIGIFLLSLASGGYQQLLIRQVLGGVRVRDVMISDPVSVPLETSLNQVTQEYFLRHGFRGFPVMEGDKAVGIISITNISETPEEERQTKTVAKAMESLNENITIEPEASLMESLEKMHLHGRGRLLVMQGDRMVGMITKTGLMRSLEMKQILQPSLA